MKNLSGRIGEYFDFDSHKTSYRIEILGGVSTFLALSYIFVVNPAILAEGGMDKSAVFFATVVASFMATLAMGLWARKPFALAPGMEMNAYVAFFVIAGLGFSWQQALGAVFWSGVIYLALTLTRFRAKIIDAIPDRMKSALALCVGVFLMLIALRISGIIVYNGVVFGGVGTLLSPMALILVLGAGTAILLNRLRVPGSVLISIVVAAVAAHLIGLGFVGQPIEVSGSMFSAILKLDIGVILNPAILSVVLVLFIIDFYGSVAKFIGLARKTTILDKKGGMKKMKEAMLVDGASNISGSVLGTTSIIVYVESRVGIKEGARTGLAAVVTALLMLSMFVIAPAVNLIPLIATAGALIFVGVSLFPSMGELKSYSKIDSITVGVMLLSVIATFAIDKALLLGFVAYIIGTLAAGKKSRINKYMVISTVLLLIGAVLTVLS